MSTWDDHIIPRAETSREGRGAFPVPAFKSRHQRLPAGNPRPPKMRCLGTMVGFGFLLLVPPPWLSSWKVITGHGHWEAISRAAASQSHCRRGQETGHLGGLPWTSSFLTSWLRKPCCSVGVAAYTVLNDKRVGSAVSGEISATLYNSTFAVILGWVGHRLC